MASDHAGMTADLKIVMERQDGIVRRAQALEVMSLDRLRHRLARDWQVLLPGVYAGFTGTVSEHQRRRAALLYAGDEAMLADATALAGYGVRYLPAHPETHVLIPAAVKRASRDGVVVRRTHRCQLPRRLDGLPYCPPERALVEFAARLCDRRTARAVIADAVQRKIAVPERLLLELPHVTGRGAGLVRAAVTDIVGLGARSGPEADFLDLCAANPGAADPAREPAAATAGRHEGQPGLAVLRRRSDPRDQWPRTARRRRCVREHAGSSRRA